MEQSEKLLKDYNALEKGAYLGAIASIATADREASEEEIEFLNALCDSADLSSEQKQMIANAATELSGEDLKKCLDVLKGSDLRFSLVTDLIAFAKSDQNYSEEEKANIEKIAQYLNINQQQYSLLDQFVQKASDTEISPEQGNQQNFSGSLGMEDKFKSAGLNMGSITKGLLGIAGPMILAGLVSRGLGGRRGGLGGGMLGGGLLGGGLLGGGFGRSRGFGSLTSMLNGGRGMGSTGGLFGRLFRGGF